eukprot:COSAG06_NODE_4429_length_4277_cov_3.529201_2_plen_169_part_00
MMCADGALRADYCLDDPEMDPYEARILTECASNLLRGDSCDDGCLCCGCSDGMVPQLRMPDEIVGSTSSASTGEEDCELPDLEQLITEIQTVCCDQQGEDCTYAPPSKCSLECSVVMAETMRCNTIQGGAIAAFMQVCAEVQQTVEIAPAPALNPYVRPAPRQPRTGA